MTPGDRTRLAVSALLGALLGVLGTSTVLRGFETYAADQFISDHARPAPSRDDLLILAIDDQSTASAPFQSPIHRKLLASVVEKLDKRGAALIALDIILDRPSFPDHDQALADAIRNARAPVVLGFAPDAGAALAACGGATATSGEAAGTRNLPLFSDAADAEASLVLCVEGDGVVRRMPGRADGAPSLAEWIARSLASRPGSPAASAPVSPGGRRHIPFAPGEAGAIPIPIHSAANLDFLPDEWVRGKAVLVGSVTPYSGDWQLTPLRFTGLTIPIEPRELMPEGKLPGVAIHAFQAAALVDDRRGANPSLFRIVALALAGGVLGALAGGVALSWTLKSAAGLLLGLGALLTGIALNIAAPGAWAVTPFPLAAAFAGGLAAAAQEQTQRAQKRMIRSAFERYLAPSVVQALVSDPRRLALTAAEREISVLFTDLAGFTTFVDAHPPEIVTRIINGYLDVIIGVVIRHGGMVDKIVGDAVHALFSAPIEDELHRERAVACALDIDAASEAYRREVKARHAIQIGHTRIGVHAGRAMVGNFGGRDRFDYTAHGTTINGAARLEAANKVFGGRICVSETARTTGPAIVWRPIARVRLRGIEAPVRVFEPLPANSPASAALAPYEAALARMGADPAEARRRLLDLQGAFPADGLVAFQLARLERGETAEDVIDV